MSAMDRFETITQHVQNVQIRGDAEAAAIYTEQVEQYMADLTKWATHALVVESLDGVSASSDRCSIRMRATPSPMREPSRPIPPAGVDVRWGDQEPFPDDPAP